MLISLILHNLRKFCRNGFILCVLVFDVDSQEGLTLIEIYDGATLEEIKSKTGAPFKISPNLIPMQQ